MVKAVVGANWGDEGKGKITDMLGKEADIIVRFQGGANAGHTIVNDSHLPLSAVGDNDVALLYDHKILLTAVYAAQIFHNHLRSYDLRLLRLENER